jgi:hypothetical protein
MDRTVGVLEIDDVLHDERLIRFCFVIVRVRLVIDHFEFREQMLVLYDIRRDTLSKDVCVNMLKRRCHQCNAHDPYG